MFRAGPSVRLSAQLRRALATHAAPPTAPSTRHSYTKQEIQKIYDTPLMELVFRAASVHRQHHDPSKIQLCTLMNIKSECPCVCLGCVSDLWDRAAGGCSEDCMFDRRMEGALCLNAAPRLVLLAVLTLRHADQGVPSR